MGVAFQGVPGMRPVQSTAKPKNRGAGTERSHLAESKVSKSVPNKVLLDHFLALKRQKLASKKKWRRGAKLSPIHWLNPKKLNLKPFSPKCVPFSHGQTHVGRGQHVMISMIMIASNETLDDDDK